MNHKNLHPMVSLSGNIAKRLQFSGKFYTGLLLVLCVLCSSAIFAQSGKVFRDGNGDGALAVSEPGIGGIKVKSYINAGATDQLLGSATTDAFGLFTLSPAAAAGQRVRIEFEIPTGLCNIDPTVDFPTIAGTGSKTTVQFATGPQTNINLGLVAQDFYVTSSNPKLWVPKYINGSGASGTTSGDNFAAVLGMNYNSTGVPASQGGTGPDPSTIVKVSQVGSVWGTAYSKQSQKLFLASFLKRHTGMGPGGSGEIYMLDPAAPPSAPTSPTFFSLDALGFPTHASGSYVATPSGFSGVIGTNAERGLPGTETSPNRDPSAFDQVGKVSLGGLDLSDDGRYLFVANLYDKKLYRVDLQNGASPVVPTAAQVTPFNNAPWLQAGFSCAHGVARPFAVKYFRGKIYVGVVCTGETGTLNSSTSSSDADELRAYVFEMSPLGDGSGAVTSIEFPLNYKKSYAGSNNTNIRGWYRWANNWTDITHQFNNSGSNEFSHPQPVFSDIEFDNDGSMILGFMDRTGHQTGKSNYRPDGTSTTLYSTYIGGDVLRTYKDPATCTYSLEENGIAGPFISTADASINGPGTHNGTGTSFTAYSGNGKEFYWGDYAKINVSGGSYPGAFHDEGVMGGLALWPSSGEVITTGLDAVEGTIWSGGVYKLNNSNGSRLVSSGYNLYNNETGTRGFGKANGLGDIEISGDLLSNLEIGNRVWLDSDADGVQDGDEDGIAGVKVDLYKADGTTFLVTATTDPSGNYYFNNLNVPGGLSASTSYVIKIPASQYNNIPVAAPLLGLVSKLTLTDIAGNGLVNLSDNDAAVVSGIVKMNASTGVLGESKHDYDIGFVPCFKVTAVHTDVTCNGSHNGAIDVTITGTPLGGAAFAWSDDNTIITEDRSGLAPGLYTVTITDQAGCSVTLSDATTTVAEPADIVITGTTTNVTTVGGSDGTIDVTVTGGNGDYTYVWNDGPVTTQDRSSLAAGSYTVTVTDKKGCTKQNTFIIKPPVCTIAVTSVVTNITCHGLTNGAINITVTGAIGSVNYLWNDGATTEDRTGLAAGVYSVTITDAVGCSTTLSDATTTINEPSSIVLGGTQVNVSSTNGSNGSIDLTVSGGTGSYTYLWNDGATTQDRTGLSAGTYSVTVTDANGCSETKTFIITQPSCSINLSAIPTAILCHGGIANIDVTVTGAQGAVSYLWNDGATTEDRTGLSAGTYSVTVTDASGCSANTSVTISEPSSIVLGGTQVNVSSTNGSNGSIDLTVSGGTGSYTYLWNDGATTQDRTGLSAGTYSVTVTDANGCSETKTFIITQPSCSINLSAIPTAILCHGGIANIDVTVTGAQGAVSYLWNDGATTEDRTGLSAGTYSITVTDASGCSANTSVTISEPSSIILGGTQVNVSSTNGSNGSIDLTVSGGTGSYTYLWNDGATTQDRTGLSAGTYSVTVTDANGCSETKTFIITQPSCSINLSAIPTAILCHGGIANIDVTVTGAQGAVSYLWNDGATTEDRTGLSAGTYSVTVTDASGCSANTSVTINEPSSIVLGGTQVNVSVAGGHDGSIDLTVSGGTGSYTYLWNDGATTQDRTGLSAGTYSVTVTDANGCSETKTFIITQPSCKISITGKITHVCCYGEKTGAIDVTVTGSTGIVTYLWNDGSTTQDRTGLAAGTYTVTATDAAGCTGTATFIVKQASKMKVTFVKTNATKNKCNGTATVSATGGTAPYTFAWSDGYVGATRNNLCAATYTVTVTDSKGCKATCTVTIICKGANTIVASAGAPETITATTVSAEFSVAVSPNPTKGLIRIALSAETAKNATVNIYDMTGKVVITEKVSLIKGMNYKEMNLSHFAQGLYQVQVISGNDKKVIKLILE